MAGGSGSLKAETAKRGKNSNRKKKARSGFNVDLTPLVDITFLLLTFFIFTTTLQEPQAMEMKIPPEVEDEIKVKTSELLTLVVRNDDKVVYIYDPSGMGDVPAVPIEKALIDDVKQTYKQELAILAMRIGPNDLVKAISAHFNLMEGKRNKMIVALKFEPHASYGKIVEVLDQLNNAEILISYVIANDRDIRDIPEIPEQRKRKFTLAPLTDAELKNLYPEGMEGGVE